ncbi:MAG: AarF/ABC1/UbiB kinase family protein [Xanthomonadaceae bacterium]|nr:AarF/ABC1/UbiB kinase family protein [Xanthomonadaceae bacterium]
MPRKKSPPKTLFSRSKEILGLTAKIITKEVSHRVSQKVDRITHQIDQAQAMVETLSSLKGAAMKAGQWIVLEARDYLPPEVIQVLSQLQDKGSHMDISDVNEIIKKELSQESSALIQSLSPEPIGSASIGQVHKATYRGESIALKVQFPGIAESIDSDLSLMGKVVTTMTGLTGKKINFAPLLEELRIVLKQEVDYKQELKLAHRYRELLKHDTRFVVPKVYPELSSSRIIALEWIEGKRFTDWIQTQPPLHHREHISKLLIDLYCMEFYDWGLVQTDPNPANFLIIETDSLPKLAVLDFGATLEYTAEFKREYIELLCVIEGGKREEIFQTASKFGFIDPRESEDTQNLFNKLMDVSVEPFRKDLQPFHFGNIDYAKRVRDSVIEFAKKVKFSSPPKKLIFINRKLGGVFNIIKMLDVKLDLVPYWNRMKNTKT